MAYYSIGNGVTDLTVYTIDGSQNVSGTFVVTVTDWVNNSNVVTFTVIRDETPPEIRGEAVRPFIQSGNDLTFDAWITDTYPIADTTVSIDGVSVHDLLDVGNNWTATRPGDLSEAVYPLTFSATDQLGNTATTTNTLIVADTDPTVDLSVVTTEPYGEVISNTMYFGNGDGAYTVTAEVSTPLAGLDTVEFGDATSEGKLHPQNGLPNVTLNHEYTFTVSSTFSNTLTVTATDRAANTTISGIPVIQDIVSPTVSISAQSSGLDITLSWSAADESSGLESCSLTIAVEGGAEEELSTDCSGSMSYPGTQDIAHVFTLTVFDKVFNEATSTASTTPNSVTKYYYLGSDRVAIRNGDGVFYLHGDHLGSTSLVTGADGEVVSESRYYPYGEERFADGSKVTDWAFTGQRHETGFGLSDYNARFFSPRIGRFISPDTIIPDPLSGDGFNRYRYSKNNPLLYVDPDGHQSACNSVCPPGPYDPQVIRQALLQSREAIRQSGRAGPHALGAAIGGTAGAAGSIFAIAYVLSEPYLNYPPPYPELSVDEVELRESFPLPSSTTLTIEGIPLLLDDTEPLITPDTGTLTPPGDPGFTLIPQQIGDNVYFSRSALRRNMGITDPNIQAHHIIPHILRNHDLVQLANQDGWDINAAYNGIPLPDNDILGIEIGIIYHSGNHPIYTADVMNILDGIYTVAQHKEWTATQAANSLIEVINGLSYTINNTRPRRLE